MTAHHEVRPASTRAAVAEPSERALRGETSPLGAFNQMDAEPSELASHGETPPPRGASNRMDAEPAELVRGGSPPSALKPYIPQSTSGLELCCEHVLQNCAGTAFCGWSLEYTNWLNWPRRFFTVSKTGTCCSWEVESGKGPRAGPIDPYTTLRCCHRMDLLQLRAMRREAPTSTTDFSFSLVGAELTLWIDPQTRDAYEQWEVAVMRAVACKDSVSQRERRAGEEQAARVAEAAATRAAAAATRRLGCCARQIQTAERGRVERRCGLKAPAGTNPCLSSADTRLTYQPPPRIVSTY